MAEGATAGKRAWNLMTGVAENQSGGASFIILLLLVLLAGIFFSVFTIYQHIIYTPPKIIIPEGQAPASDIKRLNAMIQNFNAANAARTRSMKAAEASALTGRYPFSPERAAATDDVIDVSGISSQSFIVPPRIQIKATLFIEKKAMALLDIDGEPSGKIFRAGDKFAGAKGRITRITRENITVVYEGREFDYDYSYDYPP